MYTSWFSFAYLTFGLFTAIENLGPILTLIIAYSLLKEKLSSLEVINISISMLATFLVVVCSHKSDVAKDAS